MFNACDFLAELTQHIPPRGVHLIRRYGLYSSRTKGAWDSMPHVAERAPEGWKIQHKNQIGTSDHGDFGLNEDSEMKVKVIIQQPAEIDRILRHLVKQGRPPPGLDPASLN